MSISDWPKKINTHFLLVLVVVLGLCLGWGILKVNAFSAQKTPIFVDSSAVSTPTTVSSNTTEQKTTVVASKSGSKYYFSHCSGAKSIIEKNKVYFATPLLAEKAGYELAASCKAKVGAPSDR